MSIVYAKLTVGVVLPPSGPKEQVAGAVQRNHSPLQRWAGRRKAQVRTAVEVFVGEEGSMGYMEGNGRGCFVRGGYYGVMWKPPVGPGGAA